MSIPNKFLFRVFYSLVLLCLVSDISNAQFYQGSQMTFGKNRVQYNDFLWTYYRLKRFDVYFYLGGQELATFTAKVAEDDMNKIEKIFDYQLDKRIQFIVFNKLSDLKQSNIGLSSDEQYNIGGVTKIIGHKVFLYFDGDHRKFEEQIKAGITQVLINQLLFGGDIKDMLQNATFLTLPDWYISGLVSYISKDWNVDIDNRVKDGILSGKYKRFNRLSGEDAVYAGHSIWRYIAEIYGEQSIASILYGTRISRNIENGFFLLGISSKNLSKAWLEYYQFKYQAVDSGRTLPADNYVFKKTKRNTIYSQLKVSPDGKYAAFVRNEMGKYKVYLYNFQKQKTKKLMKDGYKSIEQPDETFPLLAWHPNGKILSIIRERKGKKHLAYYYPEEKKKEESPLLNIEKILDFSYSDNGQNLVMSAVQRGQSDIYIYNLRSHTYEQITKDIYDDFNPHFVRHSTAIVFSSNRVKDSLNIGKDTVSSSSTTDIFEYDYKGKSKVLKRITNTPAINEIQPLEYDNSRLTYLSDESGIYNRYIAHLDSTISFVDTVEHYRDVINTFPITNYSRNILSQDISASGKYTQILYSQGKYKMFIEDLPKVDTIKLSIEPTSYRSQTLVKEKPKEKDTLPPPPTPIKVAIHNVFEEKDTSVIPITQKDSSKIDINNYNFQNDFSYKSKKKKEKEQLDKQEIKADSLTLPKDITVNQAVKKEDSFFKQRNYDLAFSTNYVVTQLDNTLLSSSYQLYTGGGAPYFNPGLNALMKIGISDLFDDYRIVGGVRFALNLDGNEYFLSYENLKKRLDKQIVFYRQGRIDANSYGTSVRVHTHEVKYIMKWPFSDIASIRGTIAYRNDRSAYLATDLQNLQTKNLYDNWGSLKLEYVFDNTINRGLNLYNGIRFKLFGEVFHQNKFFEKVFNQDKPNSTISIVGLDFRYYQKIHREIILANRFAASTSFGNQKLLYYMGAMDNWFAPKFDNDIPIDNKQNYLYQTLATPMRGFIQNIRNGNSFVLLNSELRIPVFKYLISRPIKSDFFKNFQVIGFGDIGTAWTGVSPYDSTNSLYTQVIRQGPLSITLFTQHEPIIAGYGWGLRSRLLGYFVRVDWSWGIEDKIKQPRLTYISLGLDF